MRCCLFLNGNKNTSVFAIFHSFVFIYVFKEALAKTFLPAVKVASGHSTVR